MPMVPVTMSGIGRDGRSELAEHVDGADAEAAGGEEVAGVFVCRGGFEAELGDAHGAEAVGGFFDEGAGDAGAAVLGIDPDIVDEAELLELVDGLSLIHISEPTRLLSISYAV